MSRFSKYKGSLMRLLLVLVFVFTPLISIRTWAFAQGSSAPVWVVRSLQTSEYGVSEPKGLAFSSEANTFLILDGSANVTLVTMGEEHAGMRAIPEVQNDPLNAAFDKKSGSLFVFKRGTSELVQINTDGKSSSVRFNPNVLGVQDPQGIAFGTGDGRLFILDAANAQIVSVAPRPTLGFDAGKVQRISLKELGIGSLKGLAYNPGNGHLYVSGPKKLYELTQAGKLVSSFDLAEIGRASCRERVWIPV